MSIEKFFTMSLPKRLAIVLAPAAALLLLIGLVIGIRDAFARRAFAQREKALVEQRQAADQRAVAAEDRARLAQALALVKDREIEELSAKAEVAEASLKAARNVTANARRNYEEIRNRPIDRSLPVPSGAELCARLNQAGFTCP